MDGCSFIHHRRWGNLVEAGMCELGMEKLRPVSGDAGVKLPTVIDVYCSQCFVMSCIKAVK